MNNQIQPSDTENLAEIIVAQDLQIRQWDEIVTADTVSYPLADFSSLGLAFSELSIVLQKIGVAAKTNGVLYEATLPVLGHLAQTKDGSGLLGTIINEKGIAGQARFKEVGKTAQMAGSFSTLFMAVAIMAINKSLKTIAENQKAVLGFLETEKQTQLQGDLNILSEVIKEYRYNWNVQQWINNREIQILDIKRNAEHSILFYREMIEKKIGSKKKVIQLDTKRTLNDLQIKFKYYKSALYIFSFASFLDIMLVKNFDGDYLNAIKDKIEKYEQDYTDFYSVSLEGVEEIAKSSVQARMLQGISATSKFFGKQIAKLPDKNNKIKLDEKLLSGGEKLDGINAKAVEDTKTSFKELCDDGINTFIDKIALINKLNNEQVKLYFDAEKIYLA